MLLLLLLFLFAEVPSDLGVKGLPDCASLVPALTVGQVQRPVYLTSSPKLNIICGAAGALIAKNQLLLP